MQGWFPNEPVKCNACGWIATNSLYYDYANRHVTIWCKCVLQRPPEYLDFMLTHKRNIAWVRNGQRAYTDEIPFFTPPIPLKANLQYACGGAIVDDYENQLQQQKPNMTAKWFPCVPLKCMECDTVSSMLYSDGNTVDMICKCRTLAMHFVMNTNIQTAHYWIVNKKTLSAIVTNDLPLGTEQLQLAGRLDFARRNKFTKEWDSTPSALQEPSNNNNNSQVDNRRLEETDKRIVALQNKVHKLSNELETQTIMMRDEISKLQRKLFRNELMCVICQTNQIDTVIECGHVFCSECVQNIAKCAFCRKQVDVTKIKKIYL